MITNHNTYQYLNCNYKSIVSKLINHQLTIYIIVNNDYTFSLKIYVEFKYSKSYVLRCAYLKYIAMCIPT